jgi:hypothetical protein
MVSTSLSLAPTAISTALRGHLLREANLIEAYLSPGLPLTAKWCDAPERALVEGQRGIRVAHGNLQMVNSMQGGRRSSSVMQAILPADPVFLIW